MTQAMSCITVTTVDQKMVVLLVEPVGHEVHKSASCSGSQGAVPFASRGPPPRSVTHCSRPARYAALDSIEVAEE